MIANFFSPPTIQTLSIHDAMDAPVLYAYQHPNSLRAKVSPYGAATFFGEARQRAKELRWVHFLGEKTPKKPTSAFF